jgi:hypothetical protein
MTLPSRAAAVRGDEYQYAIGWVAACRALDEADIVSVTIEDGEAGYFDDIVIRCTTQADEYIQVKSSNYGNVVIDDDWLMKSVGEKGLSPLRHFYETWRQLSTSDRPFILTLLTNRGFSHDHELLSKLRDLSTNRVDIEQLRGKSSRTVAGKVRDAWAKHLEINVADLLEFVGVVRWQHSDTEADWDSRAKPLMRLSGLRHDDEAVTVGKSIVRSWVTSGAGAQTRSDIRRQVAEKNILARSGVLTFAIHAIDKQETAVLPNVTVDFTDLYEGDDSFNRFQLIDPSDWSSVISPKLRAAARELEAYRTRRVHVTGSLRLPLWFAVGRELPDVRTWVLSLDQHNDEWITSATPQVGVKPKLLSDIDVGQGSELAVAIGLTTNPTDVVHKYLQRSNVPVAKLIVIGPDGDLGHDSVQSNGWLTAWVRQAREKARSEVQRIEARHVHLFMSAPASLALMLGHQWNVMPSTTLYEFDRVSYFPTITVS